MEYEVVILWQDWHGIISMLQNPPDPRLHCSASQTKTVILEKRLCHYCLYCLYLGLKIGSHSVMPSVLVGLIKFLPSAGWSQLLNHAY